MYPIPIGRQCCIEHLEHGRCDLIATHLTITAERARDVAFSVPCLPVGLGMVVREARRKPLASPETLRERGDLRVAALADISLDEQGIRRGTPYTEVVRLATIGE